MSAKIPVLLPTNAAIRVPMNVPSLGSAEGLGSNNVGVLIADTEDLVLHGTSDGHNDVFVKTWTKNGKEKMTWQNTGPAVARWFIEMFATLSLLFATTYVAIRQPQYVFGAPFIVAFVGMGMVLVTHVLFSHATGVYMNVYTSFFATIAHWIVRSMGGKSIEWLNDIVKLLLMWSAQIAGSFVGVVLALLMFLDGVTTVSILSGQSAPHYGIADWLMGPPVLVTDFQAGAAEAVGAFIVTISVLYCYGAKVLHKKVVWAGFIRGGAVFIATILFYSITGASFNPFRWVVPLAYAGAGYGPWQQAVVYTLAPFIGGAVATLFFIVWVAVVQNCLAPTKKDDDMPDEKKQLLPSANGQQDASASIRGLPKLY